MKGLTTLALNGEKTIRRVVTAVLCGTMQRDIVQKHLLDGGWNKEYHFNQQQQVVKVQVSPISVGSFARHRKVYRKLLEGEALPPIVHRAHIAADRVITLIQWLQGKFHLFRVDVMYYMYMNDSTFYGN